MTGVWLSGRGHGCFKGGRAGVCVMQGAGLVIAIPPVGVD